MDKEEIRSVLKTLADLWPAKFSRMSTAEIMLWKRTLAKYELADVVEAVESLKVEAVSGFLEMGELTGRLRVIRQRKLPPVQHQRVIDWLRKARQNLAHLDDATAILSHYSECWAAVQADTGLHGEPLNISQQAAEEIRKMIYQHCRAALLELRMPMSDANTLALAATGKDDGHGEGSLPA